MEVSTEFFGNEGGVTYFLATLFYEDASWPDKLVTRVETGSGK